MSNKIFNIYLPENLDNKNIFNDDSSSQEGVNNYTVQDDSTSINTNSTDDAPINISDNYEEVEDYSFLNIVTEEIVSVNSPLDVAHLKNILQDSFDDVQDNVNSVNENKLNLNHVDFQNIVSNLDEASDYKVFLHNVSDIEFLQAINHDHAYNIQVDNDNVSQVNNEGIDTILNHVIDHQNKI